jgi:hypothetical protein
MAAEGGGTEDLNGGRMNCDLSGWKGRKGCGSYESSVTGGINPGGRADGVDEEDRSVRRGGNAEAIATELPGRAHRNRGRDLFGEASEPGRKLCI